MIQPSKNLLLVERVEEVKKSAIIMPDNKMSRFWMMRVLAFGCEVENITGIKVKLGDILICNPLPEVDNEMVDEEHPNSKLISATHVLGRIL